MTIVRVVTPSAEVEVTGSGFVPEGQFLIEGRPVADERIMEEVESILRAGSLANDATLEESHGRWVVTGDPTEASFLVAEAKLGSTQARKTRFRRIGEIPFTSERRLMSTFEADHERGGRVALVTKGAPDTLLSRCTHVRVGDEESPLTELRRRELSSTVERLADEALRMLAVGYRIIDGDGPVPEVPEAEEGLVYLGMVGIIDPARPGARDSVAEAREAGIRVMMITGDHPRTAARIAADLGIADHGAPVVTGDEVEGLDAAALKEVLTGTTVFARVAPEHKLRFVTTLQSDGSSVAMTGDGVNDAPALKAADIGVAMGVTGTEVAKEAAEMVLADDDFTTIVAAVREGRGIFANVRKAIRFLLSSNTGEVITMFVGVVFAGFLGLDLAADGVAVPLLAPQILWINLLTDIAPALALGVDPTPPDVMRVPPRRPGQGVFDARMWAGILWVGTVMAVVTLVAIDLRLPGGVFEASGTVEEGRTMAFTTLVVAQLFNCFNARSDRDTALRGLFANPLLWGAIALSLALQIGVVHLSFLNRAFGTVPLSIGDWALCVGLASLVLWATEARKLGMRLLGR
jgi:magnesium-transporting ATPase (P-type)